jgi:hypothetical protein
MEKIIIQKNRSFRSMFHSLEMRQCYWQLIQVLTVFRPFYKHPNEKTSFISIFMGSYSDEAALNLSTVYTVYSQLKYISFLIMVRTRHYR